MLLGGMHPSLKEAGARCAITCYIARMSQRRISPIERKKSSSRKTKARLARKAETLKKIAGKQNRVHRRKR